MARTPMVTRFMATVSAAVLLSACTAMEAGLPGSGGGDVQGDDGSVASEAASDVTGATVAAPGGTAEDVAGQDASEGDPAAAESAGTPGSGTSDGSDEGAAEPDATQLAVAETFAFPVKGPADAPLTIYEFSDYRCPYCRRFATETLPQIEADYMGPNGQVNVQFIDFPLSSHGFPAVISAEAAHCAGEQDRYWEMHDAVFGSFAEMNDLPLDEEPPAIDYLVDLASEIVDDPGALRQCIESQRYRPTIGALFRDAVDAEIEVTPTLVVGGEVVLGFVEYEELRPVIERQIALALGTPVAPPEPTDEDTTPAASEG